MRDIATSGRALRAGAAAALAALVAACAQAPPAPVAFACEDGGAFVVRFDRDGERATLEMKGMRFALWKEPAPSGERYACEVLTLRRDGAKATLDVQGERLLRRCREVSASG